jgi:antitoxin component of MazEF toxin-antitoxin module
MTTLRVEQLGGDLVIRVPPEASEALGLHAGDSVMAVRAANGEVSLAAADADHQLRAERGRALLRQYQKRY